MTKRATPSHPILETIAERWSPRAFTKDIPSAGELASIFEAARWAPSCFNGQPWRFIVSRADDPDTFGKALSCLREQNASWAQNAPVLGFLIASENFEYNGKPNPWSDLDCGLAMGQLALQAQSMGWSTHIMAGFHPDRVREIFGVPEGFDPLVAFVVGKPGDPKTLPQDLLEREVAPRERKSITETVFSPEWGKKYFHGQETSDQDNKTDMN
ncbi:MAG TPA: nitroreductase family protein [Synergistales bacterium]|nr:nitroreductase family protein [Synergistales bacterium]HRV71586.1 nitroreductase family protein [Thermovirgaceae bacterium]